MAELGLAGVLLVASLIGCCFALLAVAWSRARRTESRGAIAGALAAFAAFVVHASVDWMWESTAVAALALLCVAVAGASLNGHVVQRAVMRVPLRAAAAIGSLAVLVLMLPGLASTQLLRDSQAKARAGDLGGAFTRADQAVDAQPWSASAYAQRGLVEEASGRLEQARADLADAATREPDNWRFPLLLARVDAERGDAAGALANYRRARTLRPRANVFPVPAPVAPGAAARPPALSRQQAARPAAVSRGCRAPHASAAIAALLRALRVAIRRRGWPAMGVPKRFETGSKGPPTPAASRAGAARHTRGPRAPSRRPSRTGCSRCPGARAGSSRCRS